MNVASLVHYVAVVEQQPVRRKEEPGTAAAPLPLAIPLHDIQVHDGGGRGSGGTADGLRINVVMMFSLNRRNMAPGGHLSSPRGPPGGIKRAQGCGIPATPFWRPWVPS